MDNVGPINIPAGTICPLCLDEIQQNDEIVIYPCAHQNHKECAEMWVHAQQQSSDITGQSCPVCRYQMGMVSGNANITAPPPTP